MEEAKVQFKDLSTSLKVIVILSWVMAALFALSFTIGFVGGILGVI